MERDWTTLCWPDPKFVEGMITFLKFAQEHMPGVEAIQCPCKRCKNLCFPISYEDVKIHLISNGFNQAYKVWSAHGEKPSTECIQGLWRFQEHQNQVDLNEVLNSVVEEFGGDNLDTIIEDDPYVAPEGEDAIGDNASKEFETILRDAMTALYPGCEDFTMLTFTVKLYNIKVNHGWSDQSFTTLLQLLQLVLPCGNKTPGNTYQAKKLIKKLSLDYKKIHACSNDCILYWGEHEDKNSCPVCSAPRYKIERDSTLRSNKVPSKVLRYFPLTQRLQRMYTVPWLAKEMTWHSNGRKPTGELGHPVDSSTWKFIDHMYKDFSAEHRNVRLGLATDGFNPYGTFSTSYSCWPVMCVPYNLPPHLCMKPQFTMLTLLIEGPRQPGKDIDVYLQPLIAELQHLWHKGVMTLDAHTGKQFNMRAILLWTIHDFPAYGNISGCRTKGTYACPACGPNTDSLRLHHGKKHVYMGHRRWLALNDELRKDTSAGTFNKKEEARKQPIRLTGGEVSRMTAELNMHWGKFQKKKKRGVEGGQEHLIDDKSLSHFKKSILYNLEYWEHIHVRHTLDVMHIEKNVCESLIALMLNTMGKTKDDANARKDLQRLGIKKHLWLKRENGKVIQKPNRFWLRKDEKITFMKALRELRVSIGFSSNWRNIVTEGNIELARMKSHDYHVLMQHLLPLLIQHAFRDRKEIRHIIKSFCTFFNALCARTIDVETLVTLERGMARTLCSLEMICPPSLFVVMMHLPIHLAYEARVNGPVYYRWMYPFERFMKTFKGYVSNKTRPEGCIAERYIQEETLIYCRQYKGKDNTSLLEKLEKRVDGLTPSPRELLSIIDDNFENDDGGLVGPGKSVNLEGIEYEQAHNWVLKCQQSYDEWQRKYTDYLHCRKTLAGKRSGYYKVPTEEEFLPWLKNQEEFIASTDVVFKDIVRGPIGIAMQYNKYCVNGFLFVTKDYEQNKTTQNSGVSTESMTTFRASAKDKSPVDQSVPYFGVLKKIIQLEYREGYKPVLFKCDWAKVTQHGVRIDDVAGLRLVNLTNVMSSDQASNEPFILSEHAQQVFYLKDQKDPEWHVVAEVPRKLYVEDGMHLLSEHQVVADDDVGPTDIGSVVENELMFNDPEDDVVLLETTKKRKRRDIIVDSDIGHVLGTYWI